MTQENQGTSSAVPDNLPVKRKRGRPRKDRAEASATPTTPDTEKRMKVDLVSDKKIEMVGQVVSGVLDGSFDAGYLLTVRVGDTDTVLKGIVFQPGSSVPISGSNDVAPHVKMLKRAEIHPHPHQVEDVSTPVHNASSSQPVYFNQVPIVPPQFTKGVENDTKHDPQPKSNTLDIAEEYKSKKESAQEHTGGGAHQVVQILPPADVVHSKSELNDNSCAKHDQTVNQEVMLARSEGGNGVDGKNEASTVDKLPVRVFAGEYSSEAVLPAAELRDGTYLFSSSLATTRLGM